MWIGNHVCLLATQEEFLLMKFYMYNIMYMYMYMYWPDCSNLVKFVVNLMGDGGGDNQSV